MVSKMSLQTNDRMLWKDGKKKAFTLSYDDGIEQDKRLIALLNQYGVKATFNLNTGLFGAKGKVVAGKREAEHNKISESEIASTYVGHEIAAHGQFHQLMYGMDHARCTEEILTCRKKLEQIAKEPVTGYAYAFGAVDNRIVHAVRTCGITYGRTIDATHGFDIPQDFLRWNPSCHHDDPKLFELSEKFLSDESYFSLYGPAKLFYVWGHSYEFDQNDNWHHIERFLEKIAGEDTVWYAANQEIRDYVQAYERLVFSVNSATVFNPSSISVWIGGIFTKQSVEVKPGSVTALVPAIEM